MVVVAIDAAAVGVEQRAARARAERFLEIDEDEAVALELPRCRPALPP